MQQAIKILQQKDIPLALKKFERLNIENEGAFLLLNGINELYQSQREEVCKWIVNIEQISIEYKYLAYNILGCTLEDVGDKILNIQKALNLGRKHKFDVFDPLINLQKAYLQQKEYEKIIQLVKYIDYFRGRHKVVALHIQAKANFGLNNMYECEEFSKNAFQECKKLYGIKDPMTLRLQEYLNLLSQNQSLNQNQQTPNQLNRARLSLQSRQSGTSLDFGKSFTQFEFKSVTNNIQRENSNSEEIKKTNTLDNQDWCCKLIKEYFQFANTTIIINNIQQNSDCLKLLQEYKDIFYYIQDENEEEAEDQISFDQIEIEETFNNNKYIYQLQVQNENNISQLDKMVYLQSSFIQSFLIESIQKGIKFVLNEELFQYLIIQKPQQEQNETNDFFQKLKNTLDKVVILNVNCLSETEAIRIINILKQKKIKDNILKQLNAENIILMLSSEINLNDFQLYNLLQRQAQHLQQQNQIILICMLVQPVNIGYLQKQFQDLAEKSSFLLLVEQKFEIELAFIPDANVIDQKIQQLQQKEQEFEISVSQPSLKVDNKKMFVVNSIINFWMDRSKQSMIEVQKNLSKVKDQIFEIYFPSLNIVLHDENQIKLWQKFLQQFHTNNPKESYTINTSLVIELKGESTILDKKYELILSDLILYQCKRVNFEIQEKIAKILAEKQNFEKLYISSLREISQQYGKCQIQIVGVRDNIIQVDIYTDDQTKLKNIQKQLQQDFFEQLTMHIEKNFEIEDLYYYIGMRKQEFKMEYQVEVQKIDKEYYFICQNAYLNEIKDLINTAKQQQIQNIKTKTFDCQNILVFNELKEKYQQKSTILNEEIVINFSQNQKIILQAINQELLIEKQNLIYDDILGFQNRLTSTTFLFQEKQVKFFKKYFKQFYPNVENERKAIIKFQTTQSTLISQIQQQDKKLQLVQADITLLECDAIVNFHYSEKQQQGLSRLTERILDLGGQKYQDKFYGNLINKDTIQNQFDISIYELSSFRNIHYIIDLVIPTQCQMDFKNPQSIQQILDSLFNETLKQHDITRLAIPIFNICDNDCTEIIQSYLNSIIYKLFNSEHSVRQIYITDINEKKIKFVESVLQQISEVPAQCPEKFQWQWQDNYKFVNYNEDINKQINDAYDQFLKSKQEIIINLQFQIKNKPSSHSVDLKKLKITDLQSKEEQQIIFNRQNNKITYMINNEKLDDKLTQYFINMYNYKCFSFEIFWKDLAVVINNQKTYQLNKKTQYIRTIQKIPYQQDKIELKQRITYDTSQIQEYQNQIVIQSFDSTLNNMILDEIKQKLQESSISLKIDIPQFSNIQQQKFIEYLETVAQRIKGSIISGQSINIEIFKNKEKKVFKQLDLIKSYAKKEYPKEWKPQNENVIKVKLEQNSKEYINIKNLFQKTENGTIVAIFRIQNMILWDNYILERNKVLDFYKKQQKLLHPQEQERYLWHGVSGQHPSVIYNSQKEAFDVSFSNIGLWGQGIYFAENASYSKSYSYQIKPQDDHQYAGNRVFLCCLVTTGKLEERDACREIKRPSDGFDCVTGYTGGSQIFIIYQMHVRRAYPSYEVIYY